MERFEYKLVKAPCQRKRFTGLKKSDDAFAITLTETLNDIASEGWQFLRKEEMSETRGNRLLGRRRRSHEYLVFRRQLRSNGMTLDEPVSPRRVQNHKTPDIEQLRSRISKVMLANDPAVSLVK